MSGSARLHSTQLKAHGFGKLSPTPSCVPHYFRSHKLMRCRNASQLSAAAFRRVGSGAAQSPMMLRLELPQDVLARIHEMLFGEIQDVHITTHCALQLAGLAWRPHDGHLRIFDETLRQLNADDPRRTQLECAVESLAMHCLRAEPSVIVYFGDSTAATSLRADLRSAVFGTAHTLMPAELFDAARGGRFWRLALPFADAELCTVVAPTRPFLVAEGTLRAWMDGEVH